MEDWELNAGVIRGPRPPLPGTNGKKDPNSLDEDEVAFSYPHIVQNQPEGIDIEGLLFNVHRILPGGSLSLIPVRGRHFICSVATSKVEVELDTQKFAIGTHGMWRVKYMEKCTVRNLSYGEAVVHVSAPGHEWIG